MQASQVGSGGLGAVSSGVVEYLIEGAILLLVLWGVWKLVRVIWAAVSN